MVMLNEAFRGRCTGVLLAPVLALGLLSAPPAAGQDSELQIRQIPKEKQLQQDALDEGLESGDLPERCADPEVAAKDPACVPETQQRVGEGVALPTVDDSADQKTDLVPGVTINQSRRSRK